jgi:uncharacterized protein (TIGR02246 family)
MLVCHHGNAARYLATRALGHSGAALDPWHGRFPMGPALIRQHAPCNAYAVHPSKGNAMRARNRLGVAMLLGSGMIVAGAAFAAEPELAAGDCFIAAMQAGDAEAVSMCYAEDAILWFPGGPMAKGRAAIRDGFAGYLANGTVKDVQLNAIGGEAVGDARVAWGTYAITIEDKATHAVTVERGRYTDVQKKIDGRWQYIVDHPSDEPAAPAQ